MKKYTWIAGFWLVANTAWAQQEHKLLLEANQLYAKGSYADAASLYNQVLQQNKNSVKATYNAGNTFYQQKDYDKALQSYKDAAQLSEDNAVKSKAFHNLGNAYLQKQDFQNAIDAYKNSLRLNPADFDTKNNLAYALRQQQQQQQQQQKQQQNQNNEEQKDEQKDKQQDEKNKPQQDNQPPQNNPQQQPSQQPQKPLDDIDKLMDIIENEDKNTQRKLQQHDAKRKEKNIEKDW